MDILGAVAELELANTFKKWALISHSKYRGNQISPTYEWLNHPLTMVLMSWRKRNSVKETNTVIYGSSCKIHIPQGSFSETLKIKHFGQRTEHTHSCFVFLKTYVSQMHPLCLSSLICLIDPIHQNIPS